MARLTPDASHTALGWASVVLSWHHLALGEGQHALEAIAMVQTLEYLFGHPLLEATAAWVTGAIHVLCGRPEVAIMACHQSLDSASEAVTTARLASLQSF